MPDITTDAGHIENETLLQRVLDDVSRVYGTATEEMQEKLNAWLEQYRTEDEMQRALLEAGEITQKDYKDWRRRKLLIGSRWRQMLDVLTKDAVNADLISMSIVKGHMPEAYAIGHNYGTYLVESEAGVSTSYTLYDRSTVERLIRDNPKLLPDPTPGSATAELLEANDLMQARIRANDPTVTPEERAQFEKDIRWNKQHLNNAVTQGILQGEPLTEVADRLKEVTDMDNRAANRSAATMLTSAHNGGRIDSFKRAESMGIVLKKVWLATLDGHTRTSHRHLDGQEQDTDKPFKSDLGDIMFPGDPSAHPANVYNCRCTMIAQMRGFERTVKSTELRHDDNLKGMTYEEWKYQNRREDTE